MSYVAEVLQPDEKVLVTSTIHWAIYLPGIVLAAAGFVGFFYGYGGAGADSAMRDIVWALSLLLLAAGFLSLFRAWFRRWTTEIAVTNRRVIYKRGFIRRYTVEMHMDKVESIDVDQTVLGRLLDYGDVIVRGTGTGFEPLHMIEAPIKLRNAVTAK
jgi:uncharacterized membrane protein YdbT with pleckstrin-like domain